MEESYVIFSKHIKRNKCCKINVITDKDYYIAGVKYKYLKEDKDNIYLAGVGNTEIKISRKKAGDNIRFGKVIRG